MIEISRKDFIQPGGAGGFFYRASIAGQDYGYGEMKPVAVDEADRAAKESFLRLAGKVGVNITAEQLTIKNE